MICVFMHTPMISKYKVIRVVDQYTELQSRILMCIQDVNNWIRSNRLCLNPSKTEIMIASSKRRQALLDNELSVSVGVVSIDIANSVCDLGIITDNKLTLASHVRNTVNICYANLRQLRQICKSLTTDIAQALVH